MTLTDLAERLRNRESHIDQICENAVQATFSAIGLAFDQGDDLILAKGKCPHGVFLSWVKTNFPKSIDTAQRYMRLASIPNTARMRYLSNGKSLTEALRTIGMIPETASEASGSAPSITIPPLIQKLNWLAEYFGKNPAEPGKMSDIERQELKAKLRPLNELYQSL